MGKRFGVWKFFLAVILLMCVLLSFRQAHAQETKKGKITYLYGDRETLKEGCQRAWGLVTLIEFDGMRILFDTGGERKILKNNMQKIGIDPKSIDLIVISHHHWEMLDGLPYLLENKPKLPIYATNIVINSVGDTDLFRKNKWYKNFKSIEHFAKITPNITLMKLKSRPRHGGPFGIEEIHIVLKTKEGLVILQGCGHPEIVNIMKKSIEQTKDKKVFLISGGTRMLDQGTVVKMSDGSTFGVPQPHPYSNEDINAIADELLKNGVQHIAPTHCTGDRAEGIFAKKFGDKYIKGKLGLEIALPEPLNPSAQ